MKAAPRKRRRKPSTAARLRPFWIVIVLGIALVAVLAYVALTWQGFHPHGARVEGNRVVPAADVVRAAAIDSEANVWLLSTHAMAARVEAIPYIQTARIRRAWPNRIAIVVTERHPFARLQAPNADALVDTDLRVLQPYTGGFSTLPLLVASAEAPAPGGFVKDRGTASLRDADELLVDRGVAPSELRYDKYGGLVIVLHDGITVQLGETEDLERKIALIAPILEHVRPRIREVRSIDLRAPNTPVVEYKK